jgi:hypothetical protein
MVRCVAGRAAVGAVLRFLLRDGSYHAAALTYYSGTSVRAARRAETARRRACKYPSGQASPTEQERSEWQTWWQSHTTTSIRPSR